MFDVVLRYIGRKSCRGDSIISSLCFSLQAHFKKLLITVTYIDKFPKIPYVEFFFGYKSVLGNRSAIDEMIHSFFAGSMAEVAPPSFQELRNALVAMEVASTVSEEAVAGLLNNSSSTHKFTHFMLSSEQSPVQFAICEDREGDGDGRPVFEPFVDDQFGRACALDGADRDHERVRLPIDTLRGTVE